ncbi:enoyl-CoA hydratase [Oceanicola sp. 22II-s10i]|uniref:enoyl-CoA hydratase/isomerase family protein n=1 Tax=Oceanicola sp. 22II-s10i TaxID=1317116 RepID=UPI000B521CFB|nr:enoyl-CoA hydratase/isomerase family protein [Oceanicola sp. 22II-s10i]OWU86483.1 enoyl-CoA hydratase [Oceanicola sp. 22II-s10i]
MIAVDRGADGLWTLTIDRPDKANALDGPMLEALADAAEEATQGARAVVLTGNGKVFSAGMDFEAAKSGLSKSPVWERLSGKLAALPCLTICALNGTLAGGAMGMALACDIRIAVPTAKFFYPVMKHGFLPQPSDPGRLTALIGPSRARLILLGGQRLDAEQALACGLIDRIAEPDALLATAREIAADFIAADPAFAATIKGMCR